MKVILIVLDSVGIGEAPDARAYGDEGAATLPRTAHVTGGLNVPTLQALGLGNITPLLPGGLPIAGVPPTGAPRACYGAMQPVSEGKDTITGHWEIAGLEMIPGFRRFPAASPSFPDEILTPLSERTGRGVLGNVAASGTTIIEQLGGEHMRTGALIVYTSADSVMQIAAHVNVVPLEELYAACETARALCDPYRVGRVIARPFAGSPGAFERTTDRKDFAYENVESTILQHLDHAGVPVYAVGKIEDIFNRHGITESNHTGTTLASQQAVAAFHDTKDDGLIFANFIDFDMLYGHRRDPHGYARALEQTDQWLGGFIDRLGPEDRLIITADHGNDPTFTGTDHTREFVPLLAYRSGTPGQSLGIRNGFFDIAQTLAGLFDVEPMPRGTGFWS